MKRRRVAGGGIEFAYTPEEENRLTKKRAEKEILPLMAELIEDLSTPGRSKLKSATGETKKTKLERLKRLREALDSI